MQTKAENKLLSDTEKREKKKKEENEEGKKKEKKKQIEKRQRTGPQEYAPDGLDINTKGILPAKGAFFHINHVYITARSTSTKDNPFP
ncbi:MAG: hypothetical protein ACLR8Y_00815 [Alistipes indistinctus]